MHRFWRKHKKMIINGAIFAAMVLVIVVFELISAAKMSDVEPGVPTAPSNGGVQQEKPAEEEEAFSIPIRMSVATMSDGEILTLGENCIKKNKTLTFEANVEEMGTLMIRHGDKTYGSSLLTLDDRRVEIYSFTDDDSDRKLSEEHQLSFEDQLKIHMTVAADETMDLTIESAGKTYVAKDITWQGCKGTIEVESVGNELSDVMVVWDAPDIKKDIWVFGDSYLGTRWKNRWPYYVLEAGGNNMLYTGYPGANSQAMYKEWENLLKYDTPKYAVWCVGMYDGDGSSTINMAWRAKLQLFLSDCKKLGITPILATLPNTPIVNNTLKNAYIRESGCRYIDFAKAVGATRKGSEWLTGMLANDEVHPNNAGAEALAEQVMKDFPEILE